MASSKKRVLNIRWQRVGLDQPFQHPTECIEVPDVRAVSAGRLNGYFRQSEAGDKSDEPRSVGRQDVAGWRLRTQAKATQVVPKVVQGDASETAVVQGGRHFSPREP